MKLIEVLKKPKYMLLAVVSALALLAIYAYFQNLGIVENIPFWFSIMPWYNLISLVAFLAIFGVLVAYQVHVFFNNKSCKLGKKARGVGFSSIAGGGVFFVAQCPACISLATLLLPASIAPLFITNGWAINLISIGIAVYAIHYLGGFEK
ncbi:MAG: hypothetical protein D6797_01230 [Bdellovibrio sp.]|nr:MAG: hypothetical protein D6797_01230 [Bdellovibrio sp.]